MNQNVLQLHRLIVDWVVLPVELKIVDIVALINLRLVTIPTTIHLQVNKNIYEKNVKK
jgi:hypothetical protein